MQRFQEDQFAIGARCEAFEAPEVESRDGPEAKTPQNGWKREIEEMF
jgi:hypothetical protein